MLRRVCSGLEALGSPVEGQEDAATEGHVKSGAEKRRERGGERPRDRPRREPGAAQ